MADASLTKKYLSLLNRKKSEKIRKKYLWSTIEDQLAICEACKQVATDDSRNLVIMLLESLDEEVVFAAVDALGDIGTDHIKARLQTLYNTTTNEALKVAVHNTLSKIGSRG